MIPSSFDESNAYLDAPDGFDCDPLSICRAAQRMDGNEAPIPVVISCWKPTKEELEEIKRTGRVWLTIVGDTMPPAYVGGIKPQMREEDDNGSQ